MAAHTGQNEASSIDASSSSNIQDPAVRGPRFCCPYETYHEDGGNIYCGVPCLKNPEGGFENIARLKSHLLDNHSEQYVCCHCGKSLKRDRSSTHGKDKCRAASVKCLMSPQQTNQLKRIVSDEPKAQWYKLLELVVPSLGKELKHMIPWYIPPKQRLLIVNSGNTNPIAAPPHSSTQSTAGTFEPAVSRASAQDVASIPNPLDANSGYMGAWTDPNSMTSDQAIAAINLALPNPYDTTERAVPGFPPVGSRSGFLSVSISGSQHQLENLVPSRATVRLAMSNLAMIDNCLATVETRVPGHRNNVPQARKYLAAAANLLDAVKDSVC
ncbi:hypothetical protein QQZ08_009138 [Neonectria magnoliae]|uniref:C2H2-type domain-containing protein n=1 Tax=Neonectria magnoliae TaxID=2732573 RepID=A0ABR1HR06_9HYPO